MKSHVIVYVPGLGDHKLGGQKAALKLWRVHRIEHEICAPLWMIDEPWESKLDRLLARIDHHISQGKVVSLVGISAGGAAVMAAFERRLKEVNAVVLICAKSQYPEKLGSGYTTKNPALKQAVTESARVIANLTDEQKKRILNMHPIADPIVPVQETKIPGVKNSRMPAIGHFGGILCAITIWSWQIVGFARKQATN